MEEIPGLGPHFIRVMIFPVAGAGNELAAVSSVVSVLQFIVRAISGAVHSVASYLCINVAHVHRQELSV